ncbi:hypothetical protein OROHE_015026 [Orobanche hederae]
MSGNFAYPNLNKEAISMRLLVHTLKDRAREWLDTLPPRSITTWPEFVEKFTTKYFPPIKVAKLKYEISTFRQQDSESFHEAWERYKDMLHKCPNHGFNLGAQVNYFYSGLIPSCRANVDSSSNGSLGNKTMRETYNLFDLISKQSARWPDRNFQKKPNGVLEVDAYSLMLAKIEALSKKVEDISMPNSKAIQMVQTSQISSPSCEICGAIYTHATCPLVQQEQSSSTSEQVAYAQNFQGQQYNPYSNTYNTGYKNHPNLSYANNHNVLNPTHPEKKPGWEEAISRLVEQQMKYQEGNDTSMKNLETQVGQIAKILSERTNEKLPNNTETNPRENVQAMTTRSWVQLPEIYVQNQSEKTKRNPAHESKETESEPSSQQGPMTVEAYVPPIPFPQRLKKHKLDAQFGKFLDIFKKLHINIPFADALAQMPSYAKFLKDILTNKRRIRE